MNFGGFGDPGNNGTGPSDEKTAEPKTRTKTTIKRESATTERWANLALDTASTAVTSVETQKTETPSGIQETKVVHSEVTRVETVHRSPEPQKASTNSQVLVAPLVETAEEIQSSEQSEPEVFSVSDLNKLVRQRLEGEFALVWVKGEISNFKSHTSGHFY